MKNRIRKIFKIIRCFFTYIIAVVYCHIRKVNNNDIWLISERGTDARDNGYHFYKYLKQNHKEINVKYVISKQSTDSKKIDDLDIVDYGSFKHNIYFLTSGYLISTHIMGYSPDTSLFWRLDKLGLLKLNGKKIFLQHGIINNKVPSLEKNITKLDIFISGAKSEYNYLLKNFGYDKSVIKYTGLARYDKLINNEKKQILVMPTFRKWLNYSNDFASTEYCEKWNSFLNNDRLIQYLEENDLVLYFYPHYEIQKYINNFKSKSKSIIIASFNDYDVQKLLIESQLLITDYSSVHFDFAYMRKHVIYYQFDRDRFWNEHYSKGYFDYEKDGFGPVCIEENDIINVITNNEYNQKYVERINSFFEYNDSNNCKRIFEEIKKLKG